MNRGDAWHVSWAMRGWWVLLPCLAACATTPPAVRAPPSDPSEWVAWPRPVRSPPFDRGAAAARAAASLVGQPSLRSVTRRLPDDCTGVVRYAWESVGVDLSGGVTFAGENGVTAMHRAAADHGTLHVGRPLPGDLVFFRETYDRNRDGQLNDGLTHVGLVETVDDDGTVTFIHRGGRGIQRAVMTLAAPAERRVGDRVLNDYLRPASRGAPARLTSELFVDYSTPAGPPLHATAPW